MMGRHAGNRIPNLGYDASSVSHSLLFAFSAHFFATRMLIAPMTENELSKLIASNYEAGLDSSLWSRTLHAIGEGLQAEGAAIFPVPDPQVFKPVWSDGITGLAEWALNPKDPVALSNPRAPRALALRSTVGIALIGKLV